MSHALLNPTQLLSIECTERAPSAQLHRTRKQPLPSFLVHRNPDTHPGPSSRRSTPSSSSSASNTDSPRRSRRPSSR